MSARTLPPPSPADLLRQQLAVQRSEWCALEAARTGSAAELCSTMAHQTERLVLASRNGPTSATAAESGEEVGVGERLRARLASAAAAAMARPAEQQQQVSFAAVAAGVAAAATTAEPAAATYVAAAAQLPPPPGATEASFEQRAAAMASNIVWDNRQKEDVQAAAKQAAEAISTTAAAASDEIAFVLHSGRSAIDDAAQRATISFAAQAKEVADLAVRELHIRLGEAVTAAAAAAAEQVQIAIAAAAKAAVEEVAAVRSTGCGYEEKAEEEAEEEGEKEGEEDAEEKADESPA